MTIDLDAIRARADAAKKAVGCGSGAELQYRQNLSVDDVPVLLAELDRVTGERDRLYMALAGLASAANVVGRSAGEAGRVIAEFNGVTTDTCAALESTPDHALPASSQLRGVTKAYRQGTHGPRHVYRTSEETGDVEIGVMYDPADAALVVDALNGADDRYPTVWAYEQACKAIVKHRDRADALNMAMGVLRDYANGSELSPFVQHVYQLAVDAIAADVEACNTMPPHPFVAMPASAVGSCAWCFRPEGYANHRTASTPDGPGQTETGAPRVWHVGDEEPPVGTRIMFGDHVWVHHKALQWIAEFSLGSGAPGIEWWRLTESAGPLGLREVAAAVAVTEPGEAR